MERILYILPYFELGGTERHLLNLISEVRERYQVALLTPEGEGLKLLEDFKMDFPIYHFPRLDQRLFYGATEFSKTLRTLMEAYPWDLLHVHGAHELVFLASRVLRRISGKRVPPVVFTNHGYHSNIFNLSYRSAVWVCNRMADAVICVSRFEGQRMLEAGLREDRLFVIHNGVAEREEGIPFPSAYLRERFALPEGKLFIGTVARLVKFKGIDYLISAFSEVLRVCPDCHLIIVGSGDAEGELIAQAKSLGVYDRISFTGYVKDPLSIIGLLDIFVLPSLVEPFGMVCAEAMAMSKPVIASKVGGIPEIVIHEENGYLVPPGDMVALKDRIVELVRDPAKRQLFGRNGRRRFEENFTVKAMAEKTMTLYERLAGGGPISQ